jgi:hypothetical protein
MLTSLVVASPITLAAPEVDILEVRQFGSSIKNEFEQGSSSSCRKVILVVVSVMLRLEPHTLATSLRLACFKTGIYSVAY